MTAPDDDTEERDMGSTGKGTGGTAAVPAVKSAGRQGVEPPAPKPAAKGKAAKGATGA